MDTEIWKDIPEFEGWYQISNMGRIRSIDRMVNYKHNAGSSFRKGQLLIPQLSNKGYLEVGLKVNGKGFYKRIHRLVATVFLPNPNNYPSINHINEIKTDNRAVNLEWCTHSHNKDAYTSKRLTFYQYDTNGNLIKIWHSLTKAAQSLNCDDTGIQHCCKGTLKKYKGYIWSYVPITKEELSRRNKNENITKVEQLDLHGNVLCVYDSINDAAKAIGCNASAISMACSGKRKIIKGYKWRKN